MSGVEKGDFNSTLLPNIGDARQSRRLFISRVISSAFLYAAPVWASALEHEANRKKIVRPYQLSALRDRALTAQHLCYMLPGMVPDDTLANEGRRLYHQIFANSSQR